MDIHDVYLTEEDLERHRAFRKYLQEAAEEVALWPPEKKQAIISYLKDPHEDINSR